MPGEDRPLEASSARRRTSTNRDLRITPSLTIPATELVWRASTSGGPGGQHANVTRSRVEVIFEIETATCLSVYEQTRLTERFGKRVMATSSTARSQAENRELAMTRLAARIEDALRRRTPRRPTKPTKGSKERRLTSKSQRSDVKKLRSRPSTDD